MSASPFPEPLDAPMHDFAEFDVPMNSVSQDFFLELSMDHDGHSTTYINQEGVEVDMETYDDGNIEYEMADETEEFNEGQSHYHHEPLDVEVYDASDAHPPPHSHTLPSLPANTEMSLLSSPTPFSEIFPPQPGTAPVEQSVADRLVENDTSVAEQSKFSPQQEDAPLALTLEQLPESEPSHITASDLAEATSHVLPTVDPHDIEKQSEPLVSGQANEADSSVELTEVAESSLQPQAEEQSGEQSETLHRSDVPSENGAQVQGEDHVEIPREEADDTNDPHEISEGVYIDPPPAVFVSIGSSEVPEHCLFNQPLADRGSRSPSAEVTGNHQEVYSLLLQNRPTLYYEPLSCVFEALRQDDIIAKIPDALEAELVIDAYDLQLAISEDNVYAHEISLHDLNVLHDGSDLIGPLRIHLRSAIPRFILRYRLLQEQISRLDLAAGAVEESPEEGHDLAKHHDDGHEQDHRDTESQYEAPAPDGPTDDDEAEGVHQPEVHSDLPQDEETTATDATFIPQALDDTIYHPVDGDATQALEEDGDYESTNTGTDHVEDGEGDLDAAAVHKTVNTDTVTPISNEHSRFGGEETDDLDYVEPEEYDEHYGEDFPEESYEQTVGYGESGDASTPVDELKATLPGSDLYEADTTPVPPVQLGDPTPVQTSETADSGSHEQLNHLASHKPPATESSHYTDKVLTVDQQAEQHQSNLQLPTDESDSNFLAMLERDVDSELNHSFSNSNAKQIEKGSVEEISAPLDEEWDEWDDELDADGEADEEWLDPGDTVSNESSVTLSSSSSGKRGHDEVDPEEHEFEASTSQSSPGKRPRIH